MGQITEGTRYIQGDDAHASEYHCNQDCSLINFVISF